MTNQEHIFDQIKNERLTVVEKRAMRNALLSHIHGGAIYSPYSIWGTIHRRRIALAATTIGAVLLGGTVSYAAENALPGDVLYPVKISLNERAKVALARTEEAQAIIQTKLAEERLTEAEKLAISGKLSEEKKTLVEEKLSQHLDQAQAVLAHVQLEDEELAYDLESDLRSSIGAHRSIIAAIKSGDPSNEVHELDGVEQNLALRFAYDERSDSDEGSSAAVSVVIMDPLPETAPTLMMAKIVEEQPNVDASGTATVLVAPSVDSPDALKKAQDKRAKAIQKIEASRTTIGKNEAGLERLLNAEALIARGNERIVSGDYVGARELFEQAARRAQEGKRVSELERELKIKVKTKTERSATDDEDQDGKSLFNFGEDQGAQVISTSENEDASPEDPSSETDGEGDSKDAENPSDDKETKDRDRGQRR